MSGLVDLVQLLFVVIVMIGVGLVVGAPEILAGYLREKHWEHERRQHQQAELDRKIAIAEAARAARARGETFVPPRDYDRSI